MLAGLDHALVDAGVDRVEGAQGEAGQFGSLGGGQVKG